MVLVFVYPFFLLKHLRLRKEQKIGLIGVFSLGTITLMVSLSRFIAYNVTDFELEDESGSTFHHQSLFQMHKLTHYRHINSRRNEYRRHRRLSPGPPNIPRTIEKVDQSLVFTPAQRLWQPHKDRSRTNIQDRRT
jgi:hypothetical protein